MRLGEVLNKIFRKRKQEDLISRKPAEDIYKPIEHQIEDESRFQKIGERIVTEQGETEKTEAEVIKGRNRYIIIGAAITVGIVVISLLGVIYSRIVNSTFKEEKVIISIAGPEEVLVGDIVEYKIVVENKNRANLNNVVVGLQLPNNFVLQKESFVIDKNLSGAKINVGKMSGKSEKEYKLKMQIGYSNDLNLLLKSFVEYQPENVNSHFQSSISKSVRLTQSSISASISSAESVSSSELMELKAIIRNDGNQEYEQVILSMEYPEGFNFEKSLIEPIGEKNNQWIINDLRPGSQKEVIILGRLTGGVDTIKKFRTTISKKQDKKGVLFEGEKTVKIIPSKVILKQIIEDENVYPGEQVEYKIIFKNNSTVPLRNLILKTYLPGKYVQRGEVNPYHGYYDSRENMIIWKAADVEKLKELQPNEEDSVKFIIRVQEQILPDEGDNKNPYLRIYSEIESLDVDSPIFENKKVTSPKMKTLVNSVSDVSSTIKYLTEDNNGKEREYLQVDQKVFLRVNLDITNTTNDLKNVKFLASLPSGVAWERQIYPEGDNLKFNTRTNQLEWKLGIVKSDTGFKSPAEKAEFVISVTPSINQVGDEIDLINSMQINAEDTFTGNDIEYRFNTIKSNTIKELRGGTVIATE